jgi:hypothetical protein
MKLKINNIEFQQKKFMVGRLFFKAYFDLDESLGIVYSAIYMKQEDPASPVGFEFEGGILTAPKLKNGKKLDDIGEVARRFIMRETLGRALERNLITTEVFSVSMASIGKDSDPL